MSKVRSVQDADVRGKRVLVCVDFNEPIESGRVTNDLRIRTALPTLTLLQERGAARITVMTHLGRPGGKVVDGLRVAPLVARCKELAPTLEVEMLENLRFDPREEAGDTAFAAELATHGDIFINEAFSNSHRAHASIVGVPKVLPAFAGLRFAREVAKLSEALTPPKGALAIIGGAKFETKEPLIQKLLGLYSEVLLGGALGNDLIKARGWPFGSSLISSQPVPVAVAADERLHIADDVVLRSSAPEMTRESQLGDIREGEAIVDIGARTAASWAAKINAAPFVLWNGPMGIYEQGFRAGTDALARAIASGAAQVVVGGGDTAAALAPFTLDPERVFISTGGGAMLDFLTHGTLPGIEALKK